MSELNMCQTAINEPEPRFGFYFSNNRYLLLSRTQVNDIIRTK